MAEKFKLMAHQRYALEAMEANDGLFCGYDVGTGKTMIALAYIYRHIKRGDAKDALIVCPASLVDSWKQAIEDLPKFEGYDSRAVELMKERVYITSFQKTFKTTKLEAGKKNGETMYKKIRTLRPEVDKRWSIFIIDEAHWVSAHNSAQGEIAVVLAQLSARVYLFSATPFHGGKGKPAYHKLYNEMQICSRGKRFRSWTQFCNKAVLIEDKFHKPVEYNEKYCKSLISEFMIICRAEDCLDLPEKTEVRINCKLAERKVYQDFIEKDYEKYGVDIRMAGGQFGKMLQIVSGSLKTKGGTLNFKTSKDDALADILNSTDRPVVIFCKYTASVDHAAAVARKAGRLTTVFDGRSKTMTWKDFQAGKYDCIVCQYQSGGAGLNLQRANIEVLYEPCFSAINFTQAKGRIHRPGQTHKCIYYYLYTPGTIEVKAWDTVRDGKDITDDVMKEWSLAGY